MFIHSLKSILVLTAVLIMGGQGLCCTPVAHATMPTAGRITVPMTMPHRAAGQRGETSTFDGKDKVCCQNSTALAVVAPDLRLADDMQAPPLAISPAPMVLPAVVSLYGEDAQAGIRLSPPNGPGSNPVRLKVRLLN